MYKHHFSSIGLTIGVQEKIFTEDLRRRWIQSSLSTQGRAKRNKTTFPWPNSLPIWWVKYLEVWWNSGVFFSFQQQELSQSNPSQPGNAPSSLLHWEQRQQDKGKMEQKETSQTWMRSFQALEQSAGCRGTPWPQQGRGEESFGSKGLALLHSLQPLKEAPPFPQLPRLATHKLNILSHWCRKMILGLQWVVHGCQCKICKGTSYSKTEDLHCSKTQVLWFHSSITMNTLVFKTKSVSNLHF